MILLLFASCIAESEECSRVRNPCPLLNDAYVQECCLGDECLVEYNGETYPCEGTECYCAHLEMECSECDESCFQLGRDCP